MKARMCKRELKRTTRMNHEREREREREIEVVVAKIQCVSGSIPSVPGSLQLKREREREMNEKAPPNEQASFHFENEYITY